LTLLSPRFRGEAAYYRRLGDQITSAEKTMALNQTTFHQLAVADAPIHLARSTDERGYTIPGGFCLHIQGARSADMQNGTSRIFSSVRILKTNLNNCYAPPRTWCEPHKRSGESIF
jgi:hypothetical protein